MMDPVIVLVGRPNVGKSTFFNRLTQTQNALVADYPGLTRDRQYGQALYQNKAFIVVDTGGIGVDDQAIDTLMAQQSKKALEEADHIVFMVDARSGLTGIDETIALHLRKLNKSLLLLINKIDGLSEDTVQADFQRLGFHDVFCISATHGRGVAYFLDHITTHFAEQNNLLLDDPSTICIAFAGRPNVGKSTLINRILGEERVVVSTVPGTTRDSIYIPFMRSEQKYTLIDTAGIRKKARVDEKIEKFSIIKTLQSIRQAHVCLLLLDAQEGITEQDMHVLRFIVEAGKSLVIVVNKWDGLDKRSRQHVQDELDRRLGFITYAKIQYISALHGTGVNMLWTHINQAYESAMRRFSTPYLTRLLQDIVAQHNPPLVAGRRIKMRYAHAGGHNPPIIVIHGNQLTSLPESYRRYLMKAFCDHLKLVGTPLKIEFKQNDNPYKNKRNTLTPRQIRKKKRLMQFVKKK